MIIDFIMNVCKFIFGGIKDCGFYEKLLIAMMEINTSSWRKTIFKD